MLDILQEMETDGLSEKSIRQLENETDCRSNIILRGEGGLWHLKTFPISCRMCSSSCGAVMSTEADVQTAMEVKIALLEADVNFKIVKTDQDRYGTGCWHRGVEGLNLDSR